MTGSGGNNALSPGTSCFFVSDLHGRTDRYEKLFLAIENEQPSFVFLGGDLLPSFLSAEPSPGQLCEDFIHDFLRPGFGKLQRSLDRNYHGVYGILGNDDLRAEESSIIAGGGRRAVALYSQSKGPDWGFHAVRLLLRSPNALSAQRLGAV